MGVRTPAEGDPIPATTQPRHRNKPTWASRRITAVLATIVTAGVLVGAAALWHHYAERAWPGTTVAGVDVGGLDEESILDQLEDTVSSLRLEVRVGDGTATATATELGVSWDLEAAAHDATNRKLPGGNIQLAAEVDEVALSAYASSLLPEGRDEPVNAQVTQQEDGSWVAEPGSAGRSLELGTAVAQLEQSASTLTPQVIEVDVTVTDPDITDNEAEGAVDQLEAMRKTPIAITVPGGGVQEPSPEERKTWLQVDIGDGEITARVDQGEVSSYVSQVATEHSRDPEPGLEQVDSSGDTVRILNESKDGRHVTNVDELTKGIVEALETQEPYDEQLAVEDLPAIPMKVNAPGAEGNPDAGALDGTKWIDVNLADKTATAYVGNEIVWGPRPIVDGKDGNETVTGTYEIYLRYEKQDMTNAASYPEGHPKHYYNPDVPWVQYFHRGYGFHGAPWRDSFGYSGSHGCINMPVHEAKWLYDWAGEGTRVEVHY